jgi:hypothetical protein
MTYISSHPLRETADVDHDHAWRRDAGYIDGGIPIVYSCELCDLTWTMYFGSPRVAHQRPSAENL